MRILFLDDMEDRWKKFQMANIGRVVDWAETVDTAINLLREHSYYLISLDHDLILEHYNSSECDHSDGLCGMAVAEFIAEQPAAFSSSVVHVHSLSESRGWDMVLKIRSAGIRAYRKPFNL